MLSLNLLKRTLWLFLLNLVTSGLLQVGLVACQYGNDQDGTENVRQQWWVWIEC